MKNTLMAFFWHLLISKVCNHDIFEVSENGSCKVIREGSEHCHRALSVSGVHQRGARRGATTAQRYLEGEGGPQELLRQRPIGAPAAEEEEHAVGAASEQEERQAAESDRAHLAAEARPVQTL